MQREAGTFDDRPRLREKSLGFGIGPVFQNEINGDVAIHRSWINGVNFAAFNKRQIGVQLFLKLHQMVSIPLQMIDNCEMDTARTGVGSNCVNYLGLLDSHGEMANAGVKPPRVARSA